MRKAASYYSVCHAWFRGFCQNVPKTIVKNEKSENMLNKCSVYKHYMHISVDDVFQ